MSCKHVFSFVSMMCWALYFRVALDMKLYLLDPSGKCTVQTCTADGSVVVFHSFPQIGAAQRQGDLWLVQSFLILEFFSYNFRATVLVRAAPPVVSTSKIVTSRRIYPLSLFCLWIREITVAKYYDQNVTVLIRLGQSYVAAHIWVLCGKQPDPQISDLFRVLTN